MKISASFLGIQDSYEKIMVLDKLSDYMHFDIMDGIFTEMPTLDFDLILENTKSISKPKDVHLMVCDIKKYVDMYERVNPEYITFHYEACDDILDNINYIKNKGIKVGIAIDPDTDVSLLEPYLNKIDLVLIMSVKAGKGGQPFIDVTDKIDYLYNYRKDNNMNFIIEVDGGINDVTIKKLMKADMVVVGSFITGSDDYSNQVDKLRRTL